MSNKKPYAPNERGHFDENPKVIKSYSEKDYTLLPDNISDPIVVNNISNEEFDYIYDPEHDSED